MAGGMGERPSSAIRGVKPDMLTDNPPPAGGFSFAGQTIEPDMIARHAKDGILAALDDTPVVFLSGARQVGKSTLRPTSMIDR